MINIKEYIELRDKPNRCKADENLMVEYNKNLVKKYPFIGYDDTFEFTKMDQMPDG